MTPRSEIRHAATALREHTAAVPGFSGPLAALLDACAGQRGETGQLALAVARDIRPPRRRTGNRTERNKTMQNPTVAVKGDRIEHELMPGFPMTVEDAEPCETDGTRSEPHQQYQVADPDGNTDWLCAYDVRKAG